MMKTSPGLHLACLIGWIFIAALCLPGNLFCMTSSETRDCITPLAHGTINWSNGTVTAVGTAPPRVTKDSKHEPDPGSARADANRRLIEMLKQIRIHNDLKVGMYAAQNDAIMAGIEKTARDAAIIRQYYTSALDVELAIQTRIFGGFLQLVLPEEIRQIPKINPEIRPSDQIEPGKIPYTGLILDIRELDFEPVLYPVIVSEQGDFIYASLFISREFAVQHGVCKYLCSMDNALEDPRVGSHPLVLKGLRAAGKGNTAIVISTADAKQVEKATERHLFLKQCRVIFVIRKL